MKPDKGHELTDALLDDLEKKISHEYAQAVKDTQAKLDDYLRRFEIKDEKWRLMVANGEKTEAEYKAWQKGQMMMGYRWEALKSQLAEDYHNANVIARSIIQGYMPEVYAINHNYATYRIEKDAKVNTGYTLYSRETVERILRDNPDLLPMPGAQMKQTFKDFDAYKAGETVELSPKQKKAFDKLIAGGKDIRWQEGQIQSVTLQSILTGDTIPEMAAKICTTLGARNYAAAVRYARTATTSAQNAGRYDGYRRAKKMGVDLTVEWMATLDNRTRHDHRMLHGQRREVDEPFEVDGFKILYPAQTAGESDIPQRLIWNCRCTLAAWVKGFEPDTVTYSPGMGGKSFEEWRNTKDDSSDTQKEWNKNRDHEQYDEYKKLLGKDALKSFSDFQQIKYYNQNGWNELKEQARMGRVIDKAPCTLTEKKFSGYLLKPGAKHSNDFFSVGYTEDNALRLKYDIARQFDISKAVDRAVDRYGVETFNIYMQLGVDQQKSFLMGWQVDKPGDEPRIITGFRKGPKND